jgi:PAS domain S-box-containing protein
MRIKNQFRISILAFLIIVVIIAASIIVTEQQTAQLNNQESIVGNIETGASNLNYISNHYLLYQDNESIVLWQSQYLEMSNYLSSIVVTDPQQKALIQNVQSDLDNLKIVFDGVVLFLESSGRNVSVRSLPEFQTQWSRMVVQIQALSFDSHQLSVALGDRANQLTFMSIILIVALLSLFGAYFVTNYFLQSRNTLKSISKLQEGISIIGSGDLNYSVKAGKGDEIEEISKSVNLMAANLREAEEKFKNMIEQSPDVFGLYDKDGFLIQVNIAWENLWGVPRELAIGKWNPLKSKQVSDIGWVPLIEKAYAGEAMDAPETEFDPSIEPLTMGKGRKRWIKSVIYPLKNIQGKVQNIVMMHQDVTDRKLLERQLQDKERLSAIGQTAGMVGHDLRNPLQSIIGEVYLAKGELDSLPDGENKRCLQESVQAIEEQISYMDKIVSDLQTFVKPVEAQLETINLKPLITSVLAQVDIPKNIQAMTQIQEKVITKADPQLIKRVLINLVTNAVQAMPNGGELTLRAETSNQGKVQITVKDTGTGIPDEIKDKIFTPLFTTKSKGQGFGLAVCKRVIEAQNGTITFESQVGKGTKFIIELPTS